MTPSRDESDLADDAHALASDAVTSWPLLISGGLLAQTSAVAARHGVRVDELVEALLHTFLVRRYRAAAADCEPGVHEILALARLIAAARAAAPPVPAPPAPCPPAEAPRELR